MSGKVKYNLLTEAEKKRYLGDFYSMISLLKNRDEAKNFFKDLLTLSEIVMISRRIQVAKMLLESKTYEEIKEEMHVGTATVAQVERWLNNGFGGYRKTISEFRKKYAKNDMERFGHTPFSREWTRKKYPLHYLLTNLVNKK